MDNLYQLIEKFGNPDVLIDHWDTSSNRYAIWEFEETLSINCKGEFLLNGKLYSESPLELFQKTIDIWKSESNDLSAVGYISYDFKNILFPHITFNNPNSTRPLLWFGKPKVVIPYKITESELETPFPVLSLNKDIPSPDEYKESIRKIKTALSNGDSYQINFTQPKELIITDHPLDVYLSMREMARPYRGMYLNQKDFSILSFSPEQFFRTENRKIESFPMKGTRPRSNDLIMDDRLAGELFQSVKDRAEHLMIVDLIRNDLGKICNYGSIKVDNLFAIESFETVHQMVSRVYGKLQDSITESDIIRALFPGGSITGAPKEKSMEIIDTLEGYQRGIYTGCLGYIQPNGDMNFNIAIRTMTVQNEEAVYPVGGGIVWDSDSLEEWQEAQQKGAILKVFQEDTRQKEINFEETQYFSNN